MVIQYSIFPLPNIALTQNRPRGYALSNVNNVAAPLSNWYTKYYDSTVNINDYIVASTGLNTGANPNEVILMAPIGSNMPSPVPFAIFKGPVTLRIFTAVVDTNSNWWYRIITKIILPYTQAKVTVKVPGQTVWVVVNTGLQFSSKFILPGS